MKRIARTVTRLLGPAAGRTLAIDVANSELSTAVGAATAAEGFEPADPEGLSACAVIDLPEVPTLLVPARLRTLVARVAGGGTIVVVIHGVASIKDVSAQRLGPMFDLAAVHVELTDGVAVMRGTRRLPLDRQKIKMLRGMAHDIEATVLVGRGGLTEEAVAATRESIERHGLIKVKLTPQSTLDKNVAATEMAWATGSQLVQRIGKTMVLYRPDVPLEPPVRRGGRHG